jgi:pimeloyl-ACP methyl ester carboxylesterase
MARMNAQPDVTSGNPSIETSWLHVQGIKTLCRHTRHPDSVSEAVVFVHGNPGSGADWLALMHEVSGIGRAVALDMPGFGQADKPRDFNYSVETGASFLGHALTQLGIQRAHLVLHDFGGPWGLMWAAMNPLKVASVTLINTGVLKGYKWHLMARIWRTPILGELQQALTTRAGFGWVIRWGCPRGLPDDFVNRMYDDLDSGTKRAILKLYRATPDTGPAADVMSGMLHGLDLPALVVWGEADPYLPVRFAEQQRDTFPRAELVVLGDSGHFPFADNPQAVASAVVPFLRRQVQPSLA